jgi:ornithine--oxo-acid transaminase
VTLVNLAAHNPGWATLAKRLCDTFGYDKATAMTSGSEAADAACKIARKWGTKVKGINPDEVLVLGVSENYHGLTSGVWPLMTPGDQAGEKRSPVAINQAPGGFVLAN